MGEKLVLQIAAMVLNGLNKNKAAQEFLKNIGREVKEAIPGDDIEPELAEAMDYIKEGMLEK
ncbi:MAG: hypothetical protein ACOCP4_02600 [Candidatus Woesearchaeota archaeon]